MKRAPRTSKPILLTLTPEGAAALDQLSEQTGLSRSKIVSALAQAEEAGEILKRDDPDPGVWLIEYAGKIQSARAWALELGISPNTLRYRLKQGHDLKDVFSTCGLQHKFSGRKG